MKPCEDCQASREAPAHALHCPTCLWCGARLLWKLARLKTRPPKEIKQRQTRVFNDWLRYGHGQEALRALASGEEMPLQPIGQDANGESAPPTPTKPHSATKKRSLRRGKD